MKNSFNISHSKCPINPGFNLNNQKNIYLRIIDRQKTNNVNELQTWPFRRTEVIFTEILYQGKGIFLFEIVCFKTTTEKKSQPNI